MRPRASAPTGGVLRAGAREARCWPGGAREAVVEGVWPVGEACAVRGRPSCGRCFGVPGVGGCGLLGGRGPGGPSVREALAEGGSALWGPGPAGARVHGPFARRACRVGRALRTQQIRRSPALRAPSTLRSLALVRARYGAPPRWVGVTAVPLRIAPRARHRGAAACAGAARTGAGGTTTVRGHPPRRDRDSGSLRLSRWVHAVPAHSAPRASRGFRFGHMRGWARACQGWSVTGTPASCRLLTRSGD